MTKPLCTLEKLLKRRSRQVSTWLILAHNHPSGNCTPSDADISLTHHIMSAGEKLGVGVYDHFVFSGTHTHLSEKKA
ncbi:MAG: JAB domain-containing protein [Holosporaceae bacterium]|nr:MAG: JAB domain-containing protein [Holosporaceae bacterium]